MTLRKRFYRNGEPVVGAEDHTPYLKPAAKLLDALKQRMQMGNLQQLVQRYVTETGAVLTAISRFGQDEIRIDVPQIAIPTVRRAVERVPKWVDVAQEYERGRFLVATGPNGKLYQFDANSLRLTPIQDVSVLGCPAYIAATPSRIAIADNLSDYYKYGSPEWDASFAGQSLQHPAVHLYTRGWEAAGSYTPYTVYSEFWATSSWFGGLIPKGNEFLAVTNISRFWGFTVGGGDNEYYLDRISGSGAQVSRVSSYTGDPNEWAIPAICDDGGAVLAGIAQYPYEGTAYLSPTFHVSTLTDSGAANIIGAPAYDNMAAEPNRRYALHSVAPWDVYTLSRIDRDGAIEKSVAMPAAIRPTRFTVQAGGYVGKPDIDNEFIDGIEGTFNYGRMAAGGGRLVIIAKTARVGYELHVYTPSLEFVGSVPIPAPSGFEDKSPAGAWNQYVLEGDFTVAVGFDPHWIPKFTYGEATLPDA